VFDRSARSAQPDRFESVGMQQGDGRGRGTHSGEPAAAASPRPVVVPSSHGRRPRVHRLRSQPTRRTHPRPVRKQELKDVSSSWRVPIKGSFY